MKFYSILLAVLLPAVCFAQNKTTEFDGKAAEPGKWYSVSPENAVDSKGDQWTGFFKIGSENKLLVYLFGGGVSINEYTAARGSSVPGLDANFYLDHYDEIDPAAFVGGITSDSEQNPFRNWTILLLPYTTGDFHCGAGDFKYLGLDGQEHVLYHHGYSNAELFMQQLLPILGTPESLMVTGSSAGGFGTAIMADYFIGLFPKTSNVTAFVDSGFLLLDSWPEVARDVWMAPKHIADRVKSNNITLDCLKALHNDRPAVKILFTCSTRDGILGIYQDYFINNKIVPTTAKTGELFISDLKKHVADMQRDIPGCGIFLWDDLILDEKKNLTLHTINSGDEFFKDRSGNGSIAQWVQNAVNGKIESFGLGLGY